MCVICLPFKASKNNADSQNIWKESAIPCAIFILWFDDRKFLKNCKIKKKETKEGKIKYNPKVLEPLYLD